MSHLHPHFALRLQRRARPLMSARGLRQMAAPWRFYSVAGRLVRWLGVAAALATAAALSAAHLGPTQTHALLQAPAGVMAALLYGLMAVGAAAVLLGIGRIMPILVVAAAPTAAVLSLLAVVVQAAGVPGGLGADGLWNGQLAPHAVLLPFALGVVALHGLLADPRRADRAAAVLTLAGALCAAAVRLTAGAPEPGAGLLDAPLAGWLALLAFAAYAGAVVLQRTRLEIVERGRRSLGAEEALS